MQYRVHRAASWCERLGSHLPPPRSRVRVSVTPCGFRVGRNGAWVGFSRGFFRFPLPQISFHHFSTHHSFYFINLCDGATGVVRRHPCYSLILIYGLHRISSLDSVLCQTRVEDAIYFIDLNITISENISLQGGREISAILLTVVGDG